MRHFMQTSLSTVVFLMLPLVLLGLPTWIPLLRKQALHSAPYRWALSVTAAGQVLQAAFLVGAALNVFSMAQSRAWAAAGVPVSAAGAVLAIYSATAEKNKAAWGCALTAGFTATLWLALIGTH